MATDPACDQVGIDVRQHRFDPLGPTVRTASTRDGRTMHYIDEGERSWLTLLFFGGAGTTVRSFALMEFARTLREQLRIRVISVERNGLGQTVFQSDYGAGEYANDVWDLLDALEVIEVSLVAVSGGGPYAAWVANAQPKRIRSLHLACAWAQGDGTERADFDASSVAADPISWWQFPPASCVHRIPGFVDSAIEEAMRAVFAQGADGPRAGLEQAFELYKNGGPPDLTEVDAPAFLYWGANDQVVPLVHLRRWTRILANTPVVRIYPNEGHDVQYRHWDQILTDVTYLGARTILCHEGRGVLAPTANAREFLAEGATQGLCAWT